MRNWSIPFLASVGNRIPGHLPVRELDASGLWTLAVQDLAGGDTGTLVNWSLNISGNEVAVPEPSTLGLIGLGLLGLGAMRRAAPKNLATARV